MGVRKLAVVGAALALMIGLLAAVLMNTSGPGHGIPLQQTGTAAGRPHRVPAAASLGRTLNGRVVPATTRRLPGPMAKATSKRCQARCRQPHGLGHCGSLSAERSPRSG